MKIPCSGAILAGGMNSRFGGREKAFVKVGGRPLIDRIYTVCRPLFSDLILVTNNPAAYLAWDLNIVSDLFSRRSSLTGIHTALFYAANPYVFVVACDTPFLQPALVASVVDAIDARFDAIMPETTKGREPLCAAYATRCLHAVEQNLWQDKLKIQRTFKPRRTKFLPETLLRQKDPLLRSFFNINTPADLDAAEQMLAAAEAGETETTP